MDDVATFEQFKEAWLEDVRGGSPSTVELGRRFAQKIVGQWLDLDEGSPDAIYCDGSGDGGIDFAVLERGGSDAADEDATGDVWYLVQSKYGAAFAGEDTLLIEGRKVIDTLAGQRSNLSSLAEGILERVSNFRNGASERDRIRLIFATIDPLTERERAAIEDVRTLGRSKLGALFEADAISLETIYNNLLEEQALAALRRLTVPLSGHLADAGKDLLVGSVSLTNLYSFLKAYRAARGELDGLYEKNVRRFLGGRVKVNRGMQATLRDAPERFGLYNNGITLTVSDFRSAGHGVYELVEPYVVNGCQTTRTIWEVMSSRLEAGGTGSNPDLEDWRKRAETGCVVTKIARVGDDGEALLQDVTRYTNSQNAVRDKDFIALDQDFKTWHRELADRFDLFLEIQRGGWDSQRALQKQKPSIRQFTKHAAALDLTKAYGAGWMAEPGLAFGKNPPFLPGGAVFKRMVLAPEGGPAFGALDLYAAYLLQESAQALEFGRGGPPARRQTKFLYYFVLVSLLRNVLAKEALASQNHDVSRAITILTSTGADLWEELQQAAASLIDDYMSNAGENSVFTEESYQSVFNNDLNAFLKAERLGKETPKLQTLLHFQNQYLQNSRGGAPSLRSRIGKCVQDAVKAAG